MGLFGTAGIRGDAVDDLGPSLALAVGQAVGHLAREQDGADVVLARDGRVTGPGLASAVEAGVLSAGTDVHRVGELPTPALAFASRGQVGVMVTASHNPPQDNGIKLFEDGREFDAALEARVEELVAGDSGALAWDEWGQADSRSVLAAYRSAVVDVAREHGSDPDGFEVVVDCGNGTAALVTPQVLSDLGAEVTSLNATLDGTFPARGSKPTADTLERVRRFVADGEYDLAVAHDGDADRIVVMDPAGEVVHEDTVVAILAEHHVRAREYTDPVVVTTPNASGRIDERIEAAGGRTVRVGLGQLHEGIASVEAAGSSVAFAAEPWKHVHPDHGGWIDGVASAAILARLVAAAGGIGPLVEPVDERPYEKLSIECPDERKSAAMARLAEVLPERFADATVSTEHGVRIDRPDGSWLLVRPSGTEPYIRLYAEAESVDALVAEARTIVEEAIEDADDADGSGGG